MWILLTIVLLWLLDIFLIALRASFFHVNTLRLLRHVQTEEGEKQVFKKPPPLGGLHASVNLGVVFTRFFLAALVIEYLQSVGWREWIWAWPVALLLFAALIFLSEWWVERAVRQDAQKWAQRLSFYAWIWWWLSRPLLAPLYLFNKERLMGEWLTTVTEDEVKNLVDAGEEEGIIERGERQMIYSIFELGDTLAREIMVPRIDMFTIEVNTSLEEAVEIVLQSGYSRLPVYQENVDNMVGLLYAKDLLRLWKGEQPASLRDILRPAYFVPEAKKVNELLAEMQKERIHMAIVVDEYGGIAGLVTLEDIVEEILGEIQDEYDLAEEAPYQRIGPDEYLFQGRIDLDDFNEIMGSALPPEEADTLGGFIYSRLGRVPIVGDQVVVDHLLLIVEQVIARRIRKVRARWVPPQESGA